MFQVEHFDEDFLCGLFFFFPFAFPDRGIITYDQIRGAYLAATALICQVRCNVLPRRTSGSVILFLGNAAVVYTADYPSLLAAVKLHQGMLWTQIAPLRCLDVLRPFLHPKFAYT